MYCDRCGSKMEDGQHFCARCGKQIYSSGTDPSSPSQGSFGNPRPVKKPIISKKTGLIIAGIGAAVLCVIAVAVVVGIVASNNSLSSKLTNHIWYNEANDQYLEFYENGKYVRTLRSGKTKSGNWNIEGNVLKMGSTTYSWWENLSDRDIENGTVGYSYYSWYVSDHYLVTDDDCIYGMDKPQIYD